MPPLISVIIPVYNRHELLPRALASIYAQNYPEFEIIIVDDGSEPAFNLAALPRDSRRPVQIIRQANQGAASARNRGAKEASGEFVIFWDADILAVPDMLSQMQKALAGHPESSYAYCDFYFGYKKMPAGEFNAGRLQRLNYIHTTSLLRRRDWPDFDVSLKRFQDWDMWLTLLENKKTGVYVPGFLFRVLPHRGGISRWLPRCAFRVPWRYLPYVRQLVKAHETARHVVLNKHHLNCDRASK